MARIRPEQGVMVVGRRLHSDGRPDVTPMTFRPETARVWRGILWSAEPVTVTPDDAGSFRVVLPPGAYQVETPTWTGRIVAPEGVELARFEEIVEWR